MKVVGVPRAFRAGIATYEFWLKLGIVLLGMRFLLGDVARLGGTSLMLLALELAAVDCGGVRHGGDCRADILGRGGREAGWPVVNATRHILPGGTIDPAEFAGC